MALMRVCCVNSSKLLNALSKHQIVTTPCVGYSKKGGVTAGSLGSKVGGKVGGSVGVAPPRHRLEPETDPVKLTTFLCGGNISREGGQDPELKPESEYPDWLWTLRTERGSPSLDELDPDTWEYWLKVHKYNTKRKLMTMRIKHHYHRY